MVGKRAGARFHVRALRVLAGARRRRASRHLQTADFRCFHVHADRDACLRGRAAVVGGESAIPEDAESPMNKFRIGLLVLFPTLALATTYVPQPISVYAANAETVARIYVTESRMLETEYEGKEIVCGQHVVARVVESFKGEQGEVSFQAPGMSFAPGKEYLVFIERADAKAVTPIMYTNSVSMSVQQMRAIACAKFQAEHTVSWLSTSDFLHGWNEEKREYEDWIEPAYNIAIPQDADITFYDASLHALKINGEVVEKEIWISTDAIVPDEFWMYRGAFKWSSYREYLKAEVEKVAED